VRRATNLRRKEFRTECLGFNPSPLRPKQYLKPECAVGNIKEIFNTSISQKTRKISLNILVHSSDLTPIQIHNHAYNLVGIYSEKTGYKHKWYKLHFTQQQITDNNGPVFKCCKLFYIKLPSDILKIPLLVEFPDFSLSEMSVHFIPYRKYTIRTVGNPIWGQ
jgi:hypothetical protein